MQRNVAVLWVGWVCAVEDPTGPHGGFHLEHNANQALQIYQLRAK